jgi:hypothetical protein
MQNRFAFLAALFSGALVLATPARAATPLTPEASTKAQAMQMALAQGKLVLLVAGRADCGECIDFEHNTLPACQAMVEEVFVYWYCARDGGCSDHASYVSDIGGTFPLPLICVIEPDPVNPDGRVLKRLFGNMLPSTFAGYLKQGIIKTELPEPLNLSATAPVTNSAFTVQGTMKWTSVPLASTQYRLNTGAWVSSTALGNTWNAPLSVVSSSLVVGANTLYVYAKNSSGYVTKTNAITFTYGPAVVTPTYTISGTVTLNGAALAGVQVRTNATASVATTDAKGFYSFTVPAAWSGTLTALLADYLLDPGQLSISRVGAAQPNRNFTAVAHPLALGIALPSAPAAGFGFRLAGSPGQNYLIERAPTVSGPWQVIASNLVVGPIGATNQFDPHPPSGQGFYRARRVP